MTLQDIYKEKKELNDGSLPVEFVNELAEVTGQSYARAYQWCTGNGNPSAAAAKIISQHLGIPSSELFPERRRQAVGAAVLIAGLVLAVCTGDGCAYEIPARFAGVGMVAAGGFIAKIFAR